MRCASLSCNRWIMDDMQERVRCLDAFHEPSVSDTHSSVYDTHPIVLDTPYDLEHVQQRLGEPRQYMKTPNIHE